MECPVVEWTNWCESPWEALGKPPLLWPTKDENKICPESKQLVPQQEQLVVELVVAQVPVLVLVPVLQSQPALSQVPV